MLLITKKKFNILDNIHLKKNLLGNIYLLITFIIIQVYKIYIIKLVVLLTFFFTQ